LQSDRLTLQRCDLLAQVGKKLIETEEMKIFRQSIEQRKEVWRRAVVGDDPHRIISINEPAEPPLVSKDPFLVKACAAARCRPFCCSESTAALCSLAPPHSWLV
jgi:hypothetical protein